METSKRSKEKKGHNIDGIAKVINSIEHNITELDISNQTLSSLKESMKLPANLVSLNISQNELTEVPNAVFILEKLKYLDLSKNGIQFFHDTPNFCHTIEKLNLSHNNLHGPPYWIWTQSPEKLIETDLSYNPKLTYSFKDRYFKELLEYITPLSIIKINNCNLTYHLQLLNTFSNAKVLELGSSTLSLGSLNRITEVPCEGLEKCCDIERLNLNNVQLYTINANIAILSKLVEINLSQNELSNLPDEFCNLTNLEVCDLSYNNLLYLPDKIGNLNKLTSLFLCSNELCMLPESIVQLENLRILDLYDNALYEIPDVMQQTEEIDLAQNYLVEPEDSDYLEKRGKLRLNLPERYNGKKVEVERPESEKYYEETDDEELIQSCHNNQDAQPACYERLSSPEDWDSDDYWVPLLCYKPAAPTHRSHWENFVKRKIDEGNFCPIDMHVTSVAEIVKYEKLCKPKVIYESDGQFDDSSDDNS